MSGTSILRNSVIRERKEMRNSWDQEENFKRRHLHILTNHRVIPGSPLGSKKNLDGNTGGGIRSSQKKGEKVQVDVSPGLFAGVGKWKVPPASQECPVGRGGGVCMESSHGKAWRSEQSTEGRTTQKICGRKQLTSINCDSKARPCSLCRSLCPQIRWPGGCVEGKRGLCEDVTEAVTEVVPLGETEACMSSGVW